MNAPRLVLDTNVLLDLWVFDDPRTRPLAAALDAGACVALRSDATDAEFAAVLARPRFAVPIERRQELLARWRLCALRVERVVAAALRCGDPHDQPFLDLAFSACASCLVTKDKALLRLARRARAGRLEIVDPAGLARLSGLSAPRGGGLDCCSSGAYR